MTARNRVVREPYATWCGRTPVEIIHGLLPDSSKKRFGRSQAGLHLIDFRASVFLFPALVPVHVS